MPKHRRSLPSGRRTYTTPFSSLNFVRMRPSASTMVPRTVSLSSHLIRTVDSLAFGQADQAFVISVAREAVVTEPVFWDPQGTRRDG